MIEALFPPQPPSATSAPFWSFARQGKLAIQTCDRCGNLQHPPRPVCVACLNDALTFNRVSGEGFVYSFTIVNRALIPELREEVPYILALVDLVEGPRLMSVVRDCEPGACRIGMRVMATFERVARDITLPMFRPKADGA